MKSKGAIIGGLAASIGLVLGLSGTAQAVPFTASFPSSSSTIVASGGEFFFLDTHQVSETFTGTGLASVNNLDLSLTLSKNVLNLGAFVNFDVLVNSIDVGDITFDPFDTTGVAFPFSFSFASINGAGTYNVLLDETNNVPGGDGSVAFVLNVPNSLTLNDTTSTAVPEPATLLLLGTGLFGLGLMRRRKAA